MSFSSVSACVVWCIYTRVSVSLYTISLLNYSYMQCARLIQGLFYQWKLVSGIRIGDETEMLRLWCLALLLLCSLRVDDNTFEYCWLHLKVKYLRGAFRRSRSLKWPDFPCPSEPGFWHYAAELRTLSVTNPLCGSTLTDTTDNPSEMCPLKQMGEPAL